MRGWHGKGRSLLGAAALAVGLAGCAAQHDDSLRLSEELGRARADAASQQARVAELESRLSRLEQHSAEAMNARSSEQRSIANRLDHLIDLNARMLAAQAVAPAVTAPQSQSAPASNAVSSAPTAAPAAAAAPSQEQQLRALVESMRGHPGSLHGGLTREQEDALRVLLRTERKLDDENPWPATFY